MPLLFSVRWLRILRPNGRLCMVISAAAQTHTKTQELLVYKSLWIWGCSLGFSPWICWRECTWHESVWRDLWWAGHSPFIHWWWSWTLEKGAVILTFLAQSKSLHSPSFLSHKYSCFLIMTRLVLQENLPFPVHRSCEKLVEVATGHLLNPFLQRVPSGAHSTAAGWVLWVPGALQCLWVISLAGPPDRPCSLQYS